MELVFEAAPSSVEFQYVEGKSEDRRRARMERHQRTQERVVYLSLDYFFSVPLYTGWI
ncbi:hypothetical protein ACJW30_07G089100 [Castanea mollissima]